MAHKRSFTQWRNGIAIENGSLDTGIAAGWPHFISKDVSLNNGVRLVKDTDRFGILGMAILNSRRMWLNSSLLDEIGDPLGWTTTLAHEAIHAVVGLKEEGATRKEFEILGRIYRKSLLRGDIQLANQSLKWARIANAQRLRDVAPDKRKNDRAMLRRFGFSKNATEIIMSMDGDKSKTTEEPKTWRELESKGMLVKKYYKQSLKDIEEIDKCVDGDMGLIEKGETI